MPSNFVEEGKRLQTNIPVPNIPVASIRNRLRDANSRHRSRVLIAGALAAIVVLGSGTVFAAMMFGGVRIWLSGDKAAVAMHSFVLVQNPSADDLRQVAADATFPVVFPAGIPKGMHMNVLFFSPADHPNFIEVRYRNAQSDARSAQFLLFDSAMVNQGEAATLPGGGVQQVGQATHWKIGRETVVVPGAGQRAEVKAAMSGLTPAESLAQTLPMLYRITILADQDRLADQADVIAPSEGRSVLLDRGSLSLVPSLAQSHRPLLATRRTSIESLPTVAGKPDFAHMKNHLTKESTVSADGVRALAKVLTSNACACEMLINERGGRAFWIWTLPLDASTPPTKYVVDSTKFFAVREK